MSTTPLPDGFNDPKELLAGQYATAGNLNARIALHARFSTNSYGWQRFVFDYLEALPPEAKVLEVGCGSAELWRQNAARIPAGWQITLTDFSDGMVEQARDALAESGAPLHQFQLQVANAMELPFEAAAFDGLVANHMLYHVPDVSAALAQFRRVLKMGGRLFAATNGDDHMREQWALVTRFAGAGGDDWHTVLTRAFSLQNGAEQLHAHFAQVERYDYPDTLEVTEVEPMVSYVASMGLVPPDELGAFAEFVGAILEAEAGSLRIHKQSGLFLAS